MAPGRGACVADIIRAKRRRAARRLLVSRRAYIMRVNAIAFDIHRHAPRSCLLKKKPTAGLDFWARCGLASAAARHFIELGRPPRHHAAPQRRLGIIMKLKLGAIL